MKEKYKFYLLFNFLMWIGFLYGLKKWWGLLLFVSFLWLIGVIFIKEEKWIK